MAPSSFLALALYALCVSVAHAQIGVTPVTTCAADEFFSTSALQCAKCSFEGEIPSPTAGDETCVCPYGKQKQTSLVQGTEIISCVSCSTIQGANGTVIHTEAALLDNSICLPCFGTYSYPNMTAPPAWVSNIWSSASWDASKSRCTCPTGFALSDVDMFGSISTLRGKWCYRCPPSSYVLSSSPYTCTPCSDPSMRRGSDGLCQCPASFEEVAGGVCVPSTDWDEILAKYPRDRYSSVSMNDVRNTNGGVDATYTVDQSYPFVTNFPEAASLCAYKARLSARRLSGDAPESRVDDINCQALANLCVLNMYDTNAPACALLKQWSTSESRFVNGVTSWKLNTPWIYYDASSAPTVVDATDIQRSFSLKGDSSIFNITLSAFLPNGTWLGYFPLTTQLQLCLKNTVPGSKWRNFGTYFEASCDIDVGEILTSFDTIFYDIFLTDIDASGTTILYPIPVLVENLRVGDTRPNLGATASGLDATRQLVRRFFVVDKLAGLKMRQDGSNELVAARWAESIQLRTTTVSGQGGKVHPPVLFVKYGQAVLPDATKSQLAAKGREISNALPTGVSFTVQYSMSLSQYWSTVLILFIVMCILALFMWIVRCFILNRKTQNIPVSTDYAITVVFELASTVGDFFFWFLVLMTAYWWIWFKGQDDIYVLLPLQDPHPSYLLVAIICVCCKIIEVGLGLYLDTIVDIFFIDWEKPRDQTHSMAAEGVPAVSAWRSIFVTNEWNELCALRVVNLEFTLFSIVFFLRGLDLDYLATPQPHSSDISPGPKNDALLFAVAVFFWLAIALAQVIYKHAFYFRFIEDPAAQFVDLLSIANISCLILDSPHHGFYLHGRSVHQYSDASMLEMARQLQMEEEGQVFKRGLAPNSESQVFEVFITPEVRKQYDALFMSQVVSAEVTSAAGKGQMPSMKPRTSNARNSSIQGSELSKVVQAKEKLNQFLQRLISEVQNSPAHIQDKPATFQYFGVPPEHSAATHSIFYVDNGSAFRRFLPLGQEHRLLVFDIMLFIIWILITRDVYVGTLLTYLCDKLLLWFRCSRAQTNLGRKTLVDDRFLI